MAQLIGYGTYLPSHRLDRGEIGAVLGSGGGHGVRTVAGYDEDTTSMAVEAARRALRGRAEQQPHRLLFATASPSYLDKTNANVVHAALGLDPSALVLDLLGSVRSGVGALLLAAKSHSPTVAVLSDVRVGLPGSADERDGGDGAAAFVLAEDGRPGIAEILAHASVTAEFLERWRLPDAPVSRTWEERFGEHVYLPLAEAALSAAAEKADITRNDIDTLVVAGLHGRAVRQFAAGAGVGDVVDGLGSAIGNAGVAQPGLLLADVLDRAEPGHTIALAVLADGATVIILRTTAAIATYRPVVTVAEQAASGGCGLRYADFLAWRGLLTKEGPRRPDPVGPAGPPTLRSARYKYGLVGQDCGTVHLPAVRVCISCKSVDRMFGKPMADTLATIATFTIDRLAYSPSPPTILVVIDFDGGGRMACELTDADPDAVAVGDRVEMTFRRVMTAGGIHNYFWKARPVGPLGPSRPSMEA